MTARPCQLRQTSPSPRHGAVSKYATDHAGHAPPLGGAVGARRGRLSNGDPSNLSLLARWSRRVTDKTINQRSKNKSPRQFVE